MIPNDWNRFLSFAWNFQFGSINSVAKNGGLIWNGTSPVYTEIFHFKNDHRPSINKRYVIDCSVWSVASVEVDICYVGTVEDICSAFGCFLMQFYINSGNCASILLCISKSICTAGWYLAFKYRSANTNTRNWPLFSGVPAGFPVFGLLNRRDKALPNDYRRPSWTHLLTAERTKVVVQIFDL